MLLSINNVEDFAIGVIDRATLKKSLLVVIRTYNYIDGKPPCYMLHHTLLTAR
jgi:hypothetical protein